MKHIIPYLIVFAMLMAGCSIEEESAEITEVNVKSLIDKQRENGEVPKGRGFYTIMHDPSQYSLDELIDLYKKDIKGIEQEDYNSNLKNMWLVILYPRLIEEGSDDDKLYFIEEQMNMDSNLPHVDKFYTLIFNCNKLSKEEKWEKFTVFSKKNMEVVEKIQWRSPEEKKRKLGDMIYAQRTIGILLQFSE